MIKLIHQGKDGDQKLTDIAKESESEVYDIFTKAIDQEKTWAHFLFKEGSMLGLNSQILCDYIDYLARERMAAVGLDYKCKSIPKSNPIPWINNYLNSDNVQVAPQETEISSYLVGQIESTITKNAFLNFNL